LDLRKKRERESEKEKERARDNQYYQMIKLINVR